MEGTIVRMVKDRRFGFIRAKNGTEYFFHESGLKNIKFDDLQIGREVIFEDEETSKGKRAADIFV